MLSHVPGGRDGEAADLLLGVVGEELRGGYGVAGEELCRGGYSEERMSGRGRESG